MATLRMLGLEIMGVHEECTSMVARLRRETKHFGRE
jgi:hypothetical protein